MFHSMPSNWARISIRTHGQEPTAHDADALFESNPTLQNLKDLEQRIRNLGDAHSEIFPERWHLFGEWISAEILPAVEVVTIEATG